jgi:hypothetical protein
MFIAALFKTVWRLLKKAKIEMTYDPAIPSPRNILE